MGYFVTPHSYIKTVVATFWEFLKTFLTPTSGHTGTYGGDQSLVTMPSKYEEALEWCKQI